MGHRRTADLLRRFYTTSIASAKPGGQPAAADRQPGTAYRPFGVIRYRLRLFGDVTAAAGPLPPAPLLTDVGAMDLPAGYQHCLWVVSGI